MVKEKNTKRTKTVNYLGHYINGAFEFSGKHKLNTSINRDGETSIRVSPANLDDVICKCPKEDFCPVDLVFKKGKEAYVSWSKLLLESRIKKLKPLKQIFIQNTTELAQIISRETGKPFHESLGEVKALVGKTDFVLGKGLHRIKEVFVPQAQGRIRYKSRGLFVVIGPFNFPFHLPFGQILPALVSGNSVIFKPSEKTKISGQMLAECFHKLKLPHGVFQMVQGGIQISQTLCHHKEGDGILFTGSFEVGKKIKKALVDDDSKILVLEMGGYNSALIWDYKDKKHAVSETLKGCFWSSGQRCSSTSQVILHTKIAKEFIEEFVLSAKKIRIGHPNENPFIGPLIDAAAVQRFLSFQKKVKKEGGEILLEGKKLNHLNGYYVTPGIYKMKYNKSSPIGTKETFTPQMIFYETDDLKTALEMINRSGYGLVLSLFTKNKKVKEEVFHAAKVGLINYNLSSIGASGLLPFGGLGKSGNDRPAGAFAIDFCVTPLAERTKDIF